MEPNEQLAVIIPMLKRVADGINRDQLGAATPCSEFSVEGVLDHMTSLATGFAPMFRGEDPASAPAPSDQGDIIDGFDSAMDGLLSAVESPGALERTIQTPGGEMPGDVFARLVALDGLVHGWDLATSTSQAWTPAEDLVAEVDGFARAAISPDMRDGGAFGPEQTPRAGTNAMEHLAAFTGREV